MKAGDFLFSLPLLIRGSVHLITSWGGTLTLSAGSQWSALGALVCISFEGTCTWLLNSFTGCLIFLISPDTETAFYETPGHPVRAAVIQ